MPKKTKYILFKNQNSHLHFGELLIGGEAIARIGENCEDKSFKFLGHHLDETLSWSHHTNHIFKKLVSANFALSRSKGFLPTSILKSIYQSLFESHLHFGSIVWGSAKSSMLSKLEIQQKKAIRHICLLKYNAHSNKSTINFLNTMQILHCRVFNTMPTLHSRVWLQCTPCTAEF